MSVPAMAFFGSKRRLRPTEGEPDGELNIVPYLDILMNLILFMLLSISGLATWGVVNARTPARGDGEAPVDRPPAIAVSAAGFRVGPDEVPLLADGRHDYAALTAKLGAIKRAFPAQTQIVVEAEAVTPLDVLVATMDAVREAPDHTLLFPDVTLSGVVSPRSGGGKPLQ